MSTPVGSNAAGLNRAIEVRMRHILDQEKWLQTPPVPSIPSIPPAPPAPPAPPVPHMAPRHHVNRPPRLRGGADPGEHTVSGVFAVVALVVACACVYKIVA